MLSLSPRAMYNFEPLIRNGVEDGNKGLAKRVSIMRGVFACDPDFLEGLKWGALVPDDDDEGRAAFQTGAEADNGVASVSRVQADCLDSDPLVVKTVRLRKDTFAAWQEADEYDLDWLKVRGAPQAPRSRG